MNANEMSPKAGARMNRIKKVGAILRTIFFIAALLFWILGVIYIVTSILNPNNFSETYRFLFFAYAVESVLAYKLFCLYARGDLFAAKAVHYIRWIGTITFVMGIGGILDKFFRLIGTDYFVGCFSAKGIFGLVVGIPIEMFSYLVPGLVIIFIAWIMDEGRKIQEEQALTV